MESIKSFLLERYINIFPRKNPDLARTHVDAAWDILQSAYAKIGGIHGSGFKSKEDMIANIPMWKLVRKNNKIIAAAFYKDKEGRKRVAIATDGSDFAKEALRDLITADSKTHRSYGEISGPSLSFFLKNVPDAETYLIRPKDAQRILSDDKLTFPVKGEYIETSKFPHLKDFFYTRDIGGTQHLKVMVGTSGKIIK
jgi:hypothetical protein